MAINRVNIMGNLTRDAKLGTTASGAAMLTFSVAINEKYKNKQGETVESTVFVDCSLFGSRATALAPYLTKGKKVAIDGRLHFSSWMKDDERRTALSVNVDGLEFAGGAKQTDAPAGDAPAPGIEPDLYDEDIPF